MLYFFQVIIYSSVMYGVYLLFLKNRRDHAFNRKYLRACAIIPVFVPFFRLPQFGTTNILPSAVLPVINIADKAGAVMAAPHNYGSLQSVVYKSVMLGMALLLRWQYDSMKKFMAKYKPVKMGGTYVITDTGYGPGSFRRFVFFPGNEIDPIILKHEQAHVHLKHGVEILLLRLWQCFFWPNIILFFIIREMKMVHEFQTDEYSATNVPDYASTLLNEVFQTRQFALSHTYFHHPIKRRVMMLQKTTVGNPRTNRLKTIITAGILLAGIVYIQSYTQAVHAQTAHQKNVPDSTDIPNSKGVYKHVDIMPYPKFEMAAFMQQNITYPEYARKENIQGRVIVKFTVDAEGNIVDPAIIRSPDTSLSRAALTVINKMPGWEPGTLKNGKKVPVIFYQPISFSLAN